MKIFITGANGALGRDMQHVLKSEGIAFVATDLPQLDITDYKASRAMLAKHRPDAILHFAALSDVDACEENKDLATRVNSLGTLGLALAAREIDAKLVYMSTNFVFDGTREKPYKEYDQPRPISEYGRTKYLGECYIKDLCSRYFIVRTSWLFGLNSKTYISSFLVSNAKPASINVICDQFASFTYTKDLAEALCGLIKSDHYGTYHIVNKGIGSWLDLALKAKELMRFKTALEPIKTDELKLPAPRPRYAPLDSTHYEFLFNATMRTWEAGLSAFIKSINS